MRVLKFFRRLFSAIDGVTAIEYALLGGLIAVVIVGAVDAVGVEVGNLFEFVSQRLDEAVNG